MITEDYVSFEVAKLLKEKGFDISLNYFYNSDGRRGYATSYNWNQTTGDFPDYSCPTHQMAMKWLREKQIYIRIIEDAFGESYRFEVYSKNPNVKINYYVPNYYKDTYEDAVESALNYCLKNLI